MEFLPDLPCEDFAAYLQDNGIHEDVVSNVISNRVTSCIFLDLAEDDLKEIAPAVGDRIALRKILEQARKNQLPQQDITTEVETGVTSSNALGDNTSNPVVTVNPNPGIANAATDDWHIRFTTPDLRSFSHHVKDAVTTGVITARARKEIIQVLRTYITAHTIRPTSEQYTTVCRKLVEKYPSLKDTKGTTKYSSWKLGLRNSFKNFRRGSSSKENTEPGQPPSKCLKWFDSSEPDISEEEFEQAIKELQEIHCNRGKGKSA